MASSRTVPKDVLRWIRAKDHQKGPPLDPYVELMSTCIQFPRKRVDFFVDRKPPRLNI